MKKYRLLKEHFKSERGVVAILVGIGIVLLVSMLALAIDVAYTWVTRNELQNVSDASSLAAARKLGDIYGDLSNPLSDEQVAAIRQPAIDMGSANRAGGKGIVIDSSDILIGIWDTASKTFTDTLSWPSTDPSLKPKAVKVIARRDSSTYGNGPITTFFAGIMGQPTKEVSAKAVANLSGVCIAKPPIPVGISYYRFNNPNYCDTPIRLNPTNDPASCAGWNTYFEGSHSAETLKKILEQMTARTYAIPEVQAGKDSLNFTGGTLGNAAFSRFLELFNAMRVLDQGENGPLDFDPPGHPDTWTTYVPVYEWNDCSNPNDNILIVGFAMITIDHVLPPPDKIIDAHIVCDQSVPERGGCEDFGVTSQIPGLVQ